MSTAYDPSRVLLRGLRAEAWPSYRAIAHAFKMPVSEITTHIQVAIAEGKITAEEVDASMESAARRLKWLV